MDMSLSKLQETVEDRGAWRVAIHGITESDMTQPLNDSSHVEEAAFHKGRWLYGLGQMPYLMDVSAHFFRYRYRGIAFLQISVSKSALNPLGLQKKIQIAICFPTCISSVS